MMLTHEKLFSIKKASEILGVHKITIHRWHKNKKITCFYTAGGHRRFPESELLRVLDPRQEPSKNLEQHERVLLYARISSQKQKDAGNLDRQMERLIEYVHKNNYIIIKTFKEVGSGLNENRSKLNRIFKMIQVESIEKIIIEYKERLTRFGFKYIDTLCRFTETQIEIVNDSEKKDPMQELVEDMLALISSFAARLYGRRSHARNKKK
ncbi:MAG: IS607 family transposase [Candidatus Lokiarchaeota archaeon]|nr:IS607 family transposase [Candidatus Lokiarchaeota archaeon]